MRSPRIALKTKGTPRSQARRTVAGIRLGRGAVLPVEAVVPGEAEAAAIAKSSFPAEPAVRKQPYSPVIIETLSHGMLVWGLL